MSLGIWIVGIAIILVILVFLLVVLWGWFGSRSVGNLEAMTSLVPTPGLPLTLCNEGQCQDGLQCDPYSGFCKSPVGGGCNISSDCVAPAYCSGVCVIGPHGGLNQNCPCDSGYLCVATPFAASVCKGGGGATCGYNSDCASEVCLGASCNSSDCSGGTCQAGPALGSQCLTNSQCGTGQTCSIFRATNQGFCQNSGVSTGTQGAACGPEQGRAPCNDGLVCSHLGICAVSTTGLLLPCSDTSICPTGQVCLDQTGQNCTGSCTTGICHVPYPDPNALSGLCAGGMLPEFDTCLNGVNLGCESSQVCGPGLLCTGSSALVKYFFDQANIQGTKKISLAASTNPTNMSLAVKKLFTPNNTEFLDTVLRNWIHASCAPTSSCGTSPSLQKGLWGYLDIPGSAPFLGIKPRTWTNIIPYIQTRNGRTLTYLDSVNLTINGIGNFYLALFAESDGGVTYPTLYNVKTLGGTPEPVYFPWGTTTSPWPGIPMYNGSVIPAIFVEAGQGQLVTLTGSDGDGYVGNFFDHSFTTRIPGVTGPMRIYSPTGYSYIGADGLIHLSDSPELFPLDPMGLVQYQVIDYDILRPVTVTPSAIAVCRASVGGTSNYQVVSLSAGLMSPLPYQVVGAVGGAPCSRVTLTPTTSTPVTTVPGAYYVLSPSSCQS